MERGLNRSRWWWGIDAFIYLSPVIALAAILAPVVGSDNRTPAPSTTEHLACDAYKTWCKVPNNEGGFHLVSVQQFAQDHGFTFLGFEDVQSQNDHNVIIIRVTHQEPPQ